jgi:hypothetical protein
MSKIFKYEVNISFLENPFFLYCFGFLLALFLYSWNWSSIYPSISLSLIAFLIFSFIPMILAGLFLEYKKSAFRSVPIVPILVNDLVFFLIVLLGLFNVILMGYIPFFERTRDYREFGIPVLDVFFNTFCIFFSLEFLQSFLIQKRKRLLIYFFLIVLIQIFLFRRSTIVWILVSSFFILVQYKKKLPVLILAILLFSIPLFSFGFGLFGNYRSDISRKDSFTELGASQQFENTKLNHAHYLSYLYISSPLANLQKNVESDRGPVKRKDYKNFFFYSISPSSLTLRVENKIGLELPEPLLISSNLIVGTCFLSSYLTMGWTGMIIMVIYIFVFVALTLLCFRKWNSFSVIGLSLLSTTALLLIFDNFLNRLDVILVVFIYPILFHFISCRKWKLNHFVIESK